MINRLYGTRIEFRTLEYRACTPAMGHLPRKAMYKYGICICVYIYMYACIYAYVYAYIYKYTSKNKGTGEKGVKALALHGDYPLWYP